jgi:uncharacterized phiE125 gp8 family phage protein
MALTLVTAPLRKVVDIDTFTRHLGVTEVNGGEDQFRLESLLEAARLYLEGPDGWLGRALITQEWDYVRDAFPVGREPICLPLSPAVSITSISYLDQDGATQTWSNTLYTLDKASEPARVYPNWNEIYPSARSIANAVTVRFKAGYGLLPTSVPEPIRYGIMALAAHWNENREAVVVGQTAVQIPMHVDALLASYRIHTLCAWESA